MKGFAVVKNIKANLADIISEIPEKNVDYTLLVDVSLYEKIVKQVEVDEEDEDTTFIFKPTGMIRLVRSNPNDNRPTTEYGILDGHITEEPPASTGE